MRAAALVLLAPASARQADAPDVVRALERDIQGKMYGFLAGRKGAFYVAGATSDGTIPCPEDTPKWKTACYGPWRVTENETLGFRHVFWRDGRARGEGIVTDDITGTGHSYWGWEFWRKTRVLQGDLVVNGVVYPTPAPLSLFWRPDRLTATYMAGGVVVEEVKFITADDAMISRVTVVSAPDSAESIELALNGQTYVNTEFIPTWDGDPPKTPLHVGRNSSADHDQANHRIHIVERGTAYAKPGQCTQTGNGPTYPKNDSRNTCKARVGRLMYDGMHIFVSASVPMQNVSINRTADGAMEYNFSLPLTKGQPVVLGWAQGDDMDATASKLQGLSPSMADDALKRRASDLTKFLTEQVPQFSSSDPMLNQAYLFGWAVYWMYTLDSQIGGFESRPHAQSAVNNFLGLHLHDTWNYLPMGAWVADKQTYAYGNVLLWKQALDWVKANQSTRSAFWAKQKGFLPDNFGGPWMSPSGCMELVSHIEPAWRIYETSGDKAFLHDAYQLYSGFFCFDGCDEPWKGGDGRALAGLAYLVKMSRELGLTNDTAQWTARLTQYEPLLLKTWQSELAGWLSHSDKNQYLTPFQSFEYDGIPDQWAKEAAQTWLLNDKYGFTPPNETFGAPLLAFSLNGTRMQTDGRNDPWLSHTPIVYVIANALYKHWASDEANQILRGHLKAMSRSFGFVIQPEAWSASGDYWGDAWYNWGGAATAALPLQGLAGIRYSLVGAVNTSSNATGNMPGGVLQVADSMPKDMDFIEVKVPITVDSKTTWAVVSITQSAGRKKIQVTNNPLPNLVVQPWMPGGANYVSSKPQAEGPGPDRSTWIYRGQDAASQSLTVGSAAAMQRVYIV